MTAEVMTAPPPVTMAPWWTRVWAFALVLLSLIVSAWFILHWAPVAHFVTHWTGQDDESGGIYGSWSGFLGSIQPTLVITGVIVYWHSSCHQAGCWMPGRHKSIDGSMKLCRYHHPDIRGRKLTAEVIAELHHLGHWRMHNAPAYPPGQTA